jgi:hypothetical protein
MIAAGGGGDAITAAALGPFLGLTGERPVVMTYAWERLIVDPLPGPRFADNFTDLWQHAPGVLEFVPTTRPILPAGSALPRLAAELPAHLLLLDPQDGAIGMSKQIATAAEHFAADQIVLVDVGGDVLTNGNDAGLRSPLADLLALASSSTAHLPLPAQVIIAGPGVDGELSPELVIQRVADLGGQQLTTLTPSSMHRVRSVLEWHPSEASGLLAAATNLTFGVVEIRDGGSHIRLDRRTADVFSVDLAKLLRASPARYLLATQSLSEAARLTARIAGISEIDYEVEKARSLRSNKSSQPVHLSLDSIDKVAHAISLRGASFVTIRRLAEIIGARNMQHISDLRRVIQLERNDRYSPPLYRVHDQPSASGSREGR